MTPSAGSCSARLAHEESVLRQLFRRLRVTHGTVGLATTPGAGAGFGEPQPAEQAQHEADEESLLAWQGAPVESLGQFRRA